MVTRDAVVEAWINDGEPSDLDPFQTGAPDYDITYLDPNSYGVKHYLRELSDAQIMLSNWKTSKGRPVRFDKFLTQRNVKLGMSDTLKKYETEFIDTYTIRVSSPPTWLTPDKLESARCTLIQDEALDTEDSTTQVAMLVDYDLSGNLEVQFRDEVDILTSPSLPPQVEFEFDRFAIERTGGMGNGSAVTMPTTMRNILRITTADDGSMLDHAEDKEDLYNASLTSGTPSMWYMLGDRLFLDVYIEDPQWLTLEYQRLPQSVTTLDATLDIPEQWHLVLLLILDWKGAKRLQDMEKEMLLRTQLNAMIERFRLDNEEDFLREETGNFYVRKEAR